MKAYELTFEDLPVSPRAQELIHQVNTARYKSEVRKLGGVGLFSEVRAGAITHSELEIINDERAAKLQLLTPPETRVVEVAESVVAEAADSWSPTAILDTLPPAREDFDGRERAAGEHLDR